MHNSIHTLLLRTTKRCMHLAQCDVALQHARVAAPLVLCGLAEVHGASDVCGSAVVLAARVNQQQRVGVNSPVRGTQWQGSSGSGSSGSRQEDCCQQVNILQEQEQHQSVMLLNVLELTG
jgi:hypothetical protein